MLRKALLGMLGCALAASAAVAQDSSVDLNVSSSIASKYMWNGFDRVENRGLETGPVVQPKVSVSLEGSPLKAHVGGSFVVNDNSELHETIYGVSVARAMSPVTEVSFGYNYYDDRVAEIGGAAVEDADGHEVWGKIEVTSPVGVKPSVEVKYENPKNDRDAYAVVVGSVAYSVPVVPAIGVGGVGVDLNLRTGVVYNSGVEVAGVEVLKGGVSAWQVGVAGDVKAGRVVLTPSLNYQVTVEDTVIDENPFWAGVGVSYAF